MSLTILFPHPQPNQAELSYSPIKLIAGNEYQLSFRLRATIAQHVRATVKDSTGAQVSLNDTFHLKQPNVWNIAKFEFTAIADDDNSKLRVIPKPNNNQTFYIDRVRLINLTNEKKQYRVMRIQGSIVPGSFIQTLTLREKTDAETA